MATNSNLTIGQFVLLSRRNAKMSQSELGKIANVSRNYIGAIERDEHNVTLRTLIAVVSALGYAMEINFHERSESRLTTARTGQGGDSAREGDPDPEGSTTPE